ncbi:platelet glycoprotein 4 [Trichonephila inaurata madagascariensis]|uniref:Scavenger receptor class B member 1 n=1 Tax=Trichonephila inaurata madagascariensis TaxID=2747483 RepID=A0A8X7C5V4_9ARAC|nr:platelet glycoprotein 4 [Trichonephila inaurata madagascariensis]
MKLTASRGRYIITTLGFFGVISFTLGTGLFIFFDDIVRFFMKNELVLKEGKEFYDIWKELPIPIYQKIYIFNITNPEEYENEGAKPIVQELGPYVFRGHWMKTDMNWDEEDGTLTYKDIKDYTFVPEMSSGDQEEMVYTLNGPLLAVINYVEDYAPFLFRSFVAELMNGIFESYNETLLIHRTVRELVYEGYHEPMVADLSKVVEGFLTIPTKLVNNTFGILHERKHIGDGVFTIKSGINGIDDYASIQLWNNQSVVDWWNGDECNEIRGTDGVQYAPGVTPNHTLSLFNPNLCRTIPLEYEKDVTVHGIKTLRFGMAANTFATGEENPDNKCYCEGSSCRSGIMPMNCKKGAPYVISMPHFLEGDEELVNAVEGVHPNPEKHKTYVDVEPTTGFVLNAAFRVQLNGVARRLKEFSPVVNVRDSVVPVLWMSEEAQLDIPFANYFKTRVQTPIIMFKVLCLTAIAIGGLWAVSAVAFLLCMKAKVKPQTLKPEFMKRLTYENLKSSSLMHSTKDKQRK